MRPALAGSRTEASPQSENALEGPQALQGARLVAPPTLITREELARGRSGFPTTLTDNDMADKTPINMDPATMTERDRARLAAKRMAESLLPYYGSEALRASGDTSRFSPRRTPDAFQLSQAVSTVWRQATFFSPMGDRDSFFPVFARFDNEGRLHCEDGPAMLFSDGMKIYFIHGIEVGSAVIESPHEIPIAMIRDCKNVEQRRILIERYGKDRYVTALGLKPVHKDDWGELYKAPVPNDEDLTMVKVVNNTPEPCTCGAHPKGMRAVGSKCPQCGTPCVFKDYWLSVPPSMKTAKEAVAWTWAKPADEFHPVQRS